MPHDIYARQCSSLLVHLVFDLSDGGVREVDGDEDDLGVDAVLGLREQVGGYEGGV